MSSLLKAAKDADWIQVVYNQGPPCFHLEDDRFCLRAERWDGHKTSGRNGPIHEYISLESLLRSKVPSRALLDEAGAFHCPCGKTHARGPVNGVDVYRCPKAANQKKCSDSALQ